MHSKIRTESDPPSPTIWWARHRARSLATARNPAANNVTGVDSVIGSMTPHEPCSISSDYQKPQVLNLGSAMGRFPEFYTSSLIWRCSKRLEIVTSLVTGNKVYGADQRVAFGRRPHITDIENIHNLSLIDNLQNLENRQGGTNPTGARCYLKGRAVERAPPVPRSMCCLLTFSGKTPSMKIWLTFF